MKKGPKGNTIEHLDLGKQIRQVMYDEGMNKARLARKLERNGTTIKRIIAGRSIQTYLVWEMSIALNHNFFADLAQQLDAATDGQLDKQETELKQLKAEYQRLKEERDYLRKAVDAISRDN